MRNLCRCTTYHVCCACSFPLGLFAQDLCVSRAVATNATLKFQARTIRQLYLVVPSSTPYPLNSCQNHSAHSITTPANLSMPPPPASPVPLLASPHQQQRHPPPAIAHTIQDASPDQTQELNLVHKKLTSLLPAGASVTAGAHVQCQNVTSNRQHPSRALSQNSVVEQLAAALPMAPPSHINAGAPLLQVWQLSAASRSWMRRTTRTCASCRSPRSLAVCACCVRPAATCLARFLQGWGPTCHVWSSWCLQPTIFHRLMQCLSAHASCTSAWRTTAWAG